jgi:very-short-patch-repair endonuclease/uracil-DNA glycosylase
MICQKLEAQLDKINKDIQACTRCELCDLDYNKKDIAKGYGKLYGWKGGTKKCRFLFIGMNPSYNRFPGHEYAFGGVEGSPGSGRKFNELLKETGMFEEIFCDNLIHCLTSPKTKIYTSKGWIQIKFLKVGDRVLTHLGRFRKITKVFKEKMDNSVTRIKITFINNEFEKTSKNKIIVTDEHPFLTTTGWKKASDLTTDDELISLASKCAYCNKVIIKNKYDVKKHVYCSRKCSNKYRIPKLLKKDPTLRFRLTKKANDKVRDLVKQKKWHSGDIHKNGNHWLYKLSESETKKVKRRQKLQGKRNIKIMKERGVDFPSLGTEALAKYYSTHKYSAGQKFIPIKNTKIEVLIKKGLEKENIKFKDNLRIGRYFPDIVLDEKPIIIECNGWYWHKTKKVELSSKRTKYLESKGYTVLIFDEKEILKDADRCVKEIIRILKNHTHQYVFKPTKILSIERMEKSRGFRYNLSVEEDESYIADNLVMHNCSSQTNEIKLHWAQACFVNIVDEIDVLKPELVVSMGKQVFEFLTILFRDNNIKIPLQNIWHPSYVFSYQRATKDKYKEMILEILK